jgi:hypothetical protein
VSARERKSDGGNFFLLPARAPAPSLALDSLGLFARAFTHSRPSLRLLTHPPPPNPSYSLFAAVLWPSVPLTVEEKSVGTAYGLITAIQNAGLACFPIIISVLYSAADNKYIPTVEVFFMCCACGGLIIGALLNIMDFKRGGLLNAVDVAGAKKEYEQKMAANIDTPPTPLMQT